MGYKLILYLGICLFVSCSNIHSSYYREFEKINHLDLTKIHSIFVIPNQGCGGCISEAELFYSKNRQKKDMFFIFTQVASEKYLKNKIQLSSENTYIDTNNNFIRITPREMKIYPYKITLKNGKIKSFKYNKDEENIFY